MTNTQDDGRGELLAAFTSLATFTDGLLDVMEKMLLMLASDARPTPDELAKWQQGLDGWRQSSAGLRQRIAAMAHVPPERPQ